MKIGVGYRQEMAGWISSRPRGVNCLEITADHFPPGSEDHLRKLRTQFPLYVHGLSLSLGTPGPLDVERVNDFARVAEAADAAWISEHIAFTRTSEGDLGHLNPVPPSRASLAVIADHAREVSQRCAKPMLLENITSHLKLEGDLSETDFLNQLCERSGCGLLLDVTNLFINSRNHGFDPIAWLHELDPSKIRQLHIVGYSREGNRYTDAHARPIQNELIELASEVASYARVEAVILERDEDIPSVAELEVEIAKMERIGVRA
jgi:uncharacterized protein (UPF0276 family)